MSTPARRKFAARECANVVDSETPVSAIEAGKALRDYLERKVLSGQISAVDLAIQSHYTTLAGGTGLEDFAIDPAQALKHGAEHVELILAEKYPKPTTKIIQVPACSKKGHIRETVPCPIRLPSQIISERYSDADHIEPPWD